MLALFLNLYTGEAFAAKPIPPPPPPPSDFPNQNGLNYASAYWHLDPALTTDEILHRDFRLFQDSKISLICLNVHWSYLEPSMGNYRVSYLDDVIRVCNIANQYGISVVIDFHTLMGNNSYTIPTWVSSRAFNTVMHNSTVRQAWLNMLSFSAGYLNSVPNIHSWHMMNEPYIGSWAVQCSVDDFIQLWSDMKTAIRQHSILPVTVRLAANSVLRDFENDPRMYELFDYITLTWYETYYPIRDFENLVNMIKGYGKDVTVAEWGYKTNKDPQQYSKFVTYLNLFKGLEIKWTLAWIWRSDSASVDVPETIGKGWNICKNANGDPRQSFYAIAAANN